MANRIGSYDRIDQLGKGPHGMVYLAVDTSRDRMVALKYFRSLDAIVASERARELEALVRAQSRIQAPMFATVYGCSRRGEKPAFVTREYVNGLTLSALLHHCKKLDRTFAAAILHGVATGLSAVHAADCIHGNLKTTNVMVQQSGGVKVLDPALAAPLLHTSTSGVKYETGLFGAPAFLAPEQLAGGPQTAATDVYSFGTLAHKLLLGALPFEEPELGRLRKLKLAGELMDPGLTDPTLPDALGALIRGALERRPEKRFHAMTELADQLRVWLSSAGTDPAAALLEGAQAVSYAFLMANVELRDSPRKKKKTSRERAGIPASVLREPPTRALIPGDDYFEVDMDLTAQFDRTESWPEPVKPPPRAPRPAEETDTVGMGGAAEALVTEEAETVERAQSFELAIEPEPPAAAAPRRRSSRSKKRTATDPGGRPAAPNTPEPADAPRPAVKDSRAQRRTSRAPRLAAPPGQGTHHKSSATRRRRPAEEAKDAPAPDRDEAPREVPSKPPPEAIGKPSPGPGVPAPPPVLFAPDAPLPRDADKSQRSAKETAQTGRGYLIAAAVIVAGAVVWGVLRQPEEPAPAPPTEPAAQVAPAELTPEDLLAHARDAVAQSPEEAIAAAKAAADALPELGEPLMLLARAHMRTGQYTEALEALERAEKLLPEAPEPRRLLVRLLLDRGLNRPAAETARRALKDHGSDAPLWVLLARAQLGDRRLDEAVEALATATQLNPDDGEAWLLLGETRYKQRRWLEARNAYRKAVELVPKGASGYVGLGRSLLMLGRGGDAVEILARGLSFAPNEPELRYAVGRVLLRDGRADDALGYLKEYVRSTPDDWRGHFGVGLALMQQGLDQEAVLAFGAAAKRRPNQAEIHYDLGMALASLGQWGPAVAALSEAIKLRYGLWEAHCERARIQHTLGRLEDARGGYEETAKLNEDCALARSMLETPLDSGLAHMLLALPCSPTPLLDVAD